MQAVNSVIRSGSARVAYAGIAPSPNGPLVLDHRMWDMLSAAARIAKARGAKHLAPADLVLTWLADPSRADRDLTGLDIDPSTAFEALANATRRREPPP